MKKVILFLIFSFLVFYIFTQSILATDKVEINTASLEQLETLTGIGPVKAQATIDARPFSSVDDLLRVKGIGEKTLQKIKDQGLAYVEIQNPPPAPPPPPQEQSSTTQNTQNEEKTEITNQTTIAENTTLNNAPAQNNIAINQTPNIIHPENIFINEILPNAEGADETNEWFELYNSNNFEVDLSGWKINDTKGAITNYVFSQNTKISPNGFLVFKRTNTKITLNNDGDKLDLFTPDEKVIDSATYAPAPLNQSYNKVGSNWQWSTTLTPVAANIITGTAVKTLPTSKKSVKNNTEAGLASLSSNIDINQEGIKTTNPWFLFFIAVGTSIISAIIVLIIKIRFSNHVRT